MFGESRNKRFERLVMPHLDAAYNLARWLIRNREDAEDVMQDAMLRAYRFLDSCREETARQWVIRIVRNCCYDWLSSVRATPVIGFADHLPHDPDGTAFTENALGTPADDPAQALSKKEETNLLNALIADLPAEYREVVVLRDIEGLSYDEIADIAGVPAGTVKSRLSRGRAALMEKWRERNGQP